MLQNIHHIAIIASNYERSKKFYTEVLEMPIIREVYREDRDSYKLDLQIGNSAIELFSFPDPPVRPSTPEAQGLRHLCFQVKSVEETVNWLESKGVPCEPIRTDPFDQKPFTFFRDPDDLPLEIHE